MKGRWSCISSDNDVFVMECSNCGRRTIVPAMATDMESLWKALEFCPNCNADMRSEEAIAEADRMKQKEDDLIERIADRVVEKLNKPRQGEWIITHSEKDSDYPIKKCSKCGQVIPITANINFCFNCGTDCRGRSR